MLRTAFWGALLPILVCNAWNVHIYPPAHERLSLRSGQNFAGFCAVQNLIEGQIPSIEWFLKGEKIVSGRDGISVKPGGPLKKSLTFAAPTPERSGNYTCRVAVDGDERDEVAEFKFTEPIKFFEPKSEQHPLEGSKARIECFVHADPPAEVTWQRGKDSMPIGEGGDREYILEDNRQVLVIPKYEANRDDDVYTCHASQLTTFEEIKINVTGYAPPAIIIFEGEGRGNEGQNKLLGCQAIGKPTPIYSWYKGSTESKALQNTDKYQINSGSLEIDTLSEADEDQYICVASNEVGSAQRAANVTVFLKPSIEVIPAMDVDNEAIIDIQCRYKGTGKMSAKWMIGDEELEMKKPELMVANVIEEQEDDVAQSDADMSTEAANESRRKRQILSDRHSVRADEGVLTLHIDGIKEADTGEYRCVVENEAGKQIKSTRLRIKHSPEIIFKSNDMRLPIGETFNLTCEVRAVPHPTFKWTLRGGEIKEDGDKYTIDSTELKTTLTVRTNSDKDYGLYTCKADNKVGSAEEETKVIQALIPPVPMHLQCEDGHPNYGSCTVDQYDEKDESHMPTSFHLQSAMTDETKQTGFDWNLNAHNTTVSYDQWHRIILTGLSTNTKFSVRARAVNEAGASPFSEIIEFSTSEAQVPAIPSDVNVDCKNLCQISWEAPNDHGAPITGYVLLFRRKAPVNTNEGMPEQGEFVEGEKRVDVDPDIHNVEVSDLRPLSGYQLQLIASNAVGNSAPYTEMFETSEYSAGTGIIPWGLSIGQLVAIVAVILLLLLILIDLLCFAVNRWGLLACFCTNCLGRNIHNEKKTKDVERGHLVPENEPLVREQVKVTVINSTATYSNGGASATGTQPTSTAV